MNQFFLEFKKSLAAFLEILYQVDKFFGMRRNNRVVLKK